MDVLDILQIWAISRNYQIWSFANIYILLGVTALSWQQYIPSCILQVSDHQQFSGTHVWVLYFPEAIKVPFYNRIFQNCTIFIFVEYLWHSYMIWLLKISLHFPFVLLLHAYWHENMQLNQVITTTTIEIFAIYEIKCILHGFVLVLVLYHWKSVCKFVIHIKVPHYPSLHRTKVNFQSFCSVKWSGLLCKLYHPTFYLKVNTCLWQHSCCLLVYYVYDSSYQCWTNSQ